MGGSAWTFHYRTLLFCYRYASPPSPRTLGTCHPQVRLKSLRLCMFIFTVGINGIFTEMLPQRETGK